MIKSERQAYILHQVNLHNKVLLTDLSEQVSVSNDTIRRDLQELSDLGKIIKVQTGGGTTIIEMARALPQNLHATFISGSIPALFEYSSHPNIEVIAIGDKVSKNSKITVGSDAILKIREFRADLCFLGVNAINLQTGISDNDWDIVQVKKAMIDSAKKLVCLTISEKIDSRQPIQICDLKRIDTLITEISPEDASLESYIKAGITVL